MYGKNIFHPLILTTLVTLLIVVMTSDAGRVKRFEDDYNWEDYKEKYNKHYSPKEDLWRKKLFLKNVEEVKAHNKLYKEGKSSWKAGLNEFSDWTDKEKAQLNGFKTTKKH